MYHRLCLNLCERSLYRASSGIRFQFNRLNHVISKREEQQKVKISTRFPDCKVIYTFPYIKYISNVNIIKKRFTIFIGAVIPLTICLQLTNIISLDAATGFILIGIVLTLWLHSFGLYCNNFIGHAYLKPHESKVILSYVSYWGKRIDLETTFDDIIPLSDNPLAITDFVFKKIKFASRKKTLKIDVKRGEIIDYNFKYILGEI